MTKAKQKMSETYDRARKGYSRAVINRILKWNPRMGREQVVDLGTGTGILLFPLSKHFRSAQGFDISEDRIRQARKRNLETESRIRFDLGSAEHIKHKSASVDLVTTAQSFMYFKREKALAEIIRVLRPGGTLGILWKYPDFESPFVRILNKAIADTKAYFGRRLPIREIPDSTLTVRNESILSDLTKAGFKRLSYDEIAVELKYTRADYLLWGVHSTGFVTERRAPEVQEYLLARMDKKLRKIHSGGPIVIPFIQHLFLAEK